MPEKNQIDFVARNCVLSNRQIQRLDEEETAIV